MIIRLVKLAFYLALLALIVVVAGSMVLLSLAGAVIDAIQGAPAG